MVRDNPAVLDGEASSDEEGCSGDYSEDEEKNEAVDFDGFNEENDLIEWKKTPSQICVNVA